MKRKLDNFFNQLQFYQNLDISFNGEIEPKTTDQLTSRVLDNCTAEEISQLLQWIEKNQLGQIMEFLAYDVNLDFSFEYHTN